jgi:hypothetical protein
MNRSLYISIVSLFSIFLLSTCAQRGGNDPLGVTGGSHGGYGYSKDYYRNIQDGVAQGSSEIFGVWTDDDITITIDRDGTFKIKSAEKIRAGTFSIVEDQLTLSFKDGTILSYSYTFTKEQLTLEEIE